MGFWPWDAVGCQGLLRWTPHPVIVTKGDNRDYIRVLLYSYYTTITGWGVFLRDYFVVLGLSTQPLRKLELKHAIGFELGICTPEK